MNDDLSTHSVNTNEELKYSRSRIDPERLKSSNLLHTGRFPETDIQRARAQIAALRSEVRLLILSYSMFLAQYQTVGSEYSSLSSFTPISALP